MGGDGIARAIRHCWIAAMGLMLGVLKCVESCLTNAKIDASQE